MNFIIFPLILTFVYAQPPREKLLVELNLSRPLSMFIRTLLPPDMPDALEYVIKTPFKHSHRIGAVVDAGHLVVDADVSSSSRSVLVKIRDDGSKYIKVTTTKVDSPNTATIEEFVKSQSNPNYRKLSRVLYDVDLLLKKGNGILKVIKFLRSGSLRYTVQKNMRDDFTIGLVTFGKHIVDDNVSGLVYRDVIWEGGMTDPQITIRSQYRDGSEVEIKYEFENDEISRFYCSGIRRKYPDLQ
ncbi:signal peptide containing protein [Theileria equi strain WA]|uniref:Signal peptide containing protein n=1 Tax=Theileria equi strain WA TaxID=1537102 RepID=L1LE58_THEEQ|nr:signal peptide containing protein [Theileria equi strain WA]EKX73535.1 signal peptide containing protein [Theileria equi strain WA]|eukprot:XP_004832987.1 signal peptide containing protein [Theileria equi strain WA]